MPTPGVETPVTGMDRIRQGGRVAVLANFFLDMPVSAMQSIYIVLKKVSETCYPPSLKARQLASDRGRIGLQGRTSNRPPADDKNGVFGGFRVFSVAQRIFIG